MSLKFPELAGKNVGYICITRKGKFKASIGKVVASDGDNDNFLYELASRQPRELAEEAVADLVEAEGQLAHVFKVPVRPSPVGIWQSCLEEAESSV